jgi:hypothetical protein
MTAVAWNASYLIARMLHSNMAQYSTGHHAMMVIFMLFNI